MAILALASLLCFVVVLFLPRQVVDLGGRRAVVIEVSGD